MEANDIQLQQKDVEIQRQATKLRERALEFNKEQKELLTLRVRKLLFYCMSEEIMTLPCSVY